MYGCVEQVWLQEFAWTEDEKLAKLQRRNRCGPQGRQLAKEPLFCFEYAMNMSTGLPLCMTTERSVTTESFISIIYSVDPGIFNNLLDSEVPSMTDML